MVLRGHREELIPILQMTKLRPGKRLGDFFKGKVRNGDRTSRTLQDLRPLSHPA